MQSDSIDKIQLRMPPLERGHELRRANRIVGEVDLAQLIHFVNEIEFPFQTNRVLLNVK